MNIYGNVGFAIPDTIFPFHNAHPPMITFHILNNSYLFATDKNCIAMKMDELFPTKYRLHFIHNAKSFPGNVNYHYIDALFLL